MATASLAVLGVLGLTGSATGHDRACPEKWTEAFVVPGTFKDKNENGRICFNAVPGQGNAAGEGAPGFNTKDDHVH